MLRTSCVKQSLAATILVCLLFVSLGPAATYAGDSPAAGAPRLMRITPSQSQGVGRDITLALSFDRPMDLSSISEAVSFEPPLAFTVSGEAECLIVPSGLLEGDRQYTFRLQAGKAHDLDSEICADGLEMNFTTRNDASYLAVPDMAFEEGILEGKDAQGVVSALGFGVGHYPGAGRPGAGNLVLMAHASAQISFPFNHLQELKAGAEMRVRYAGRTYVYQINETMVVSESDMWILDEQDYPMLTIFVCSGPDGRPSPTFHPPYRYVIRAALTSANP
ncbi:MAG: hypothetical protein A2W01_10385 [Candidatus Solincola sediminis]|uniref:SbsA Ig-like domain-containing protein n=1 Tax=Candidatus Solincola sediminis TaxID=1797199 RepID=A0A1F2WFU6_9ACTN|nr:MAG: hypothetical protein A2Y75_05965 [Candidatus Solincola sediminis]OFW59997.1 MAG: hypothetical protein A2W01_10385 [Candidatus Solincola sediminis]